jgi:hypothetical protein
MNRNSILVKGAIVAGLLFASMAAEAAPYVNSSLNGDRKTEMMVSSVEARRDQARQATNEAAYEATRSILLENKTALEIRLKDHTSRIVASL